MSDPKKRYRVVTWEGALANRYESDELSEEEARTIARAQRNEDQDLHAVIVEVVPSDEDD